MISCDPQYLCLVAPRTTSSNSIDLGSLEVPLPTLTLQKTDKGGGRGRFEVLQIRKPSVHKDHLLIETSAGWTVHHLSDTNPQFTRSTCLREPL